MKVRNLTDTTLEEARLTGEPFSQGYPIEGTDADANKLGQYYFGPTVVVTDALAFSTADMFAAGFIDHSIGKVICIDKNMAAAGGNNWAFDILRLFLPTFQLDVGLKADLDQMKVTDELKNAFNRFGVSLSGNVINLGPKSQYGGTVWHIRDGEVSHEIRHVPWMGAGLFVYPSDGESGVRELPDQLRFGFTVRRCVRTGPNEGRLLEDLGIRPDIEYKPTKRDVLEKNQDLIIRATLELSQMPVYDLVVETKFSQTSTQFTCRALNITDLEVYADGKHFDSMAIGSTSVRFDVPSGFSRIEIHGFNHDMLVARRIIQPLTDLITES